MFTSVIASEWTKQGSCPPFPPPPHTHTPHAGALDLTACFCLALPRCQCLPEIPCECLSTCLSACLPFGSRGRSYRQWLAAVSCVGRGAVVSRGRRKRRRRKAVQSVAPTFFHLFHVAVAPDPVVHFLTVGLLAAAQHRQRAARLLYHVHDAVQELQPDKVSRVSSSRSSRRTVCCCLKKKKNPKQHKQEKILRLIFISKFIVC